MTSSAALQSSFQESSAVCLRAKVWFHAYLLRFLRPPDFPADGCQFTAFAGSLTTTDRRIQRFVSFAGKPDCYTSDESSDAGARAHVLALAIAPRLIFSA